MSGVVKNLAEKKRARDLTVMQRFRVAYEDGLGFLDPETVCLNTVGVVLNDTPHVLAVDCQRRFEAFAFFDLFKQVVVLEVSNEQASAANNETDHHPKPWRASLRLRHPVRKTHPSVVSKGVLNEERCDVHHGFV